MFRSSTKNVISARPLSQLRQSGSWLFGSLCGSRGTIAGLALIDCLIVGGTNFLTVLLLGRFAGPDDLGLFALVMTVFYLLLAAQESLITMPYTIFGVRLTRVRSRQYAAAALCQSVVWSACVLSLLLIAAASLNFFGNDSNAARVVGAFSIVSPLWLLREFGRRYLFAHMEVAKVVVVSFVGGLAQLMLVCGFAYSGRLSAVSALMAIGIASGVSGLGWLWFNRAAFQFNHRRWAYFALKNWVFGRWVIASHAAAVVAANMMPWLIVIWLGPAATGVYAACDAILRFANPIIVSVSNVITPRAAIGHNDGGKAELRRIVWNTSALLSLFLLAFSALLVVAGKWLLNESFGGDYAAHGNALVVLGISQLVAKLSLAPGRALLVLDRATANLRAEAAGLVTTFVAAILLIPVFGLLGAAFSQLAGSVALAFITLRAYRTAMHEGDGEPFLAFGGATAVSAPAGGAFE
jgi:O-antigen/teichoic acid export membrane protein